MKGFKERRALPVRVVFIRSVEAVVRRAEKPEDRKPRSRRVPVPTKGSAE